MPHMLLDIPCQKPLDSTYGHANTLTLPMAVPRRLPAEEELAIAYLHFQRL